MLDIRAQWWSEETLYFKCGDMRAYYTVVICAFTIQWWSAITSWTRACFTGDIKPALLESRFLMHGTYLCLHQYHIIIIIAITIITDYLRVFSGKKKKNNWLRQTLEWVQPLRKLFSSPECTSVFLVSTIKPMTCNLPQKWETLEKTLTCCWSAKQEETTHPKQPTVAQATALIDTLLYLISALSQETTCFRVLLTHNPWISSD